MSDAALRSQLAKVLRWEDAHATFERVFVDVPEHTQGTRPPGLPHSLWELLEHLRITQLDILEFCRNPAYEEREWPADYWPSSTGPPDRQSWDQSIRDFLRDREEMARLAEDPEVDLLATIPIGSGQTYLREVLLVADHNAHHLGQAILVRRALGIWG